MYYLCYELKQRGQLYKYCTKTMQTLTATAMPVTLEVFQTEIFHLSNTRENIKQLLRGWLSSPMVEFEGFGQSRLDIFDTIDRLVNVLENAASQSDEEIEEAIEEFVTFHETKKEALSNLKRLFQGYTGSLVVEKSGERAKRAAVVDTYYELVAIVNELFARA